MQRKQELENELRNILENYTSEESKRAAPLFLQKIADDTTLSKEDILDLLKVEEPIKKSRSLFSQDYINLSQLLIDLGNHHAHDLIKCMMNLNIKYKRYHVVHGDRSINSFLTQNHIDLIYISLINGLILPKYYPEISKQADALVNHIFQLGFNDKWQAFEFAFKQEHPLHLVLKNRDDLLNQLRNAIHHNHTPPPAYIPSPPSNESQPRLYPSIYPNLQEQFNAFPIYTSGLPNIALYQPTPTNTATHPFNPTLNDGAIFQKN